MPRDINFEHVFMISEISWPSNMTKQNNEVLFSHLLSQIFTSYTSCFHDHLEYFLSALPNKNYI